MGLLGCYLLPEFGGRQNYLSLLLDFWSHYLQSHRLVEICLDLIQFVGFQEQIRFDSWDCV